MQAPEQAPETITVGSRVTTGDGRFYRVVAVSPVFGIPAADLVRLRKDGSDAVRTRRTLKNLPLSCLQPAGKPLVEIL